MKKFLLTSLFCVMFLFCFCGMTKAAEWTDVTGDLSGTNVHCLIQASDGSIYAGGDYGNSAKIWRYSNNTWTDTGFLPGSNINALLQASDGYIYAGNDSGKVLYYFNGSWEDTGSLSEYAESINSLIQSSDGSIYAGGANNYAYMEDGLWRYLNHLWTYIEVPSIGGSKITSIIQAFDSSIYVADSLGHVLKYSNGSWTDVTGALSANWIASLIQASDGTIFAGGNNNLLVATVWKYSSESWNDTGSIVGTYVSALIQASDGSIYAGVNNTASAKLWKYSNSSWEEIVESSGVYSIGSLVKVSDGSIYVGGSDGHSAKVWKYAFSDQQIQQNNLEQGEKVILESALNQQSITGQDLTINFKKLPTKLTKNSKYWMKWNKNEGYRSSLALSVKKSALKKYWKLTTNLNKYKAKKVKQQFKIKVTFNYTKAEFKALKKKNKLAKEKDLFLKFKVKGGTWKSLADVWTTAKIKHNVKKHKFSVTYFTKFPKKSYYFGIMLK